MKMKAEPGSWWKKIKQHPFIAVGIAVLGSLWKQIQKYRRAIGVVAIVLTVIIVLIIAGYWLNWTGFNGYDKVTKDFTPGGQLVKTTSEYQSGKTLWDWLQLLIIPVVLAVAGFLLNQLQKDRDQKAQEAQKQREENAAKEREKLERESREDYQREAALQAYIDNLSALLLDRNLRYAQHDEAGTIARVRTLRVLPRLDGERKRNVIQFLHESGLINKNTPIIDLHEADLREASLDDAELKDANLSGAKLMKANLEGAKLNGAYLREADLREADLRGAQMNNKTDLSGAILKGANYNTNRMQGMNAQGIPLTLEPTQWPQGFDYKSTGAISVDS